MTDVVLDPVFWGLAESGAPAFVQHWLVSEGDLVHSGQAIASIHVGNDTIAMSATHTGTVEEILVGAGGSFVQGVPLARLIAM